MEAEQLMPQQSVKPVVANVISMSIEEAQGILREMYVTTCEDGANSLSPESNVMLYQSQGDTGTISIFAVSPKNTYGYHRRLSVGSHNGYFTADKSEGGKLPMTPDGERKAFLSWISITELNQWAKKLPKTGTILFIWLSQDGTEGEFCARCIPKLVKAKEPDPYVIKFSYPELCSKWVENYRLPFNMGRAAQHVANTKQFMHTFGAFSLNSNVIGWLAAMIGEKAKYGSRFVFFNRGNKCYTTCNGKLELWFALCGKAESRIKP